MLNGNENVQGGCLGVSMVMSMARGHEVWEVTERAVRVIRGLNHSPEAEPVLILAAIDARRAPDRGWEWCVGVVGMNPFSKLKGRNAAPFW